MADAGIFFEFLPMSDFDEGRLPPPPPEGGAARASSTGVNYAVVITTPAGLARYLLGDVVRFLSTQPPRLVTWGAPSSS
jgi:hypothetical protein